MVASAQFDVWTAGQNYERYMGRWSRRLAAAFVDWLEAPRDADWIDVGCGTGALTAAVLETCAPRSVLGVDASEAFVAHASATIGDPRARFEAADAARLPAGDASRDVAVSGLVLNFLPDPAAALGEMARVLRPGGMLGFTVWDYPGGGVDFVAAFWEEAAELDARAAELDERRRFAAWTRDGVAAICAEADLRAVAVEPLHIETVFPSFEDFWQPFTLGAGPAPGFCVSLPLATRATLRARLEARLGPAGPLALAARAWAAKGRRP